MSASFVGNTADITSRKRESNRNRCINFSNKSTIQNTQNHSWQEIDDVEIQLNIAKTWKSCGFILPIIILGFHLVTKLNKQIIK